MEPKLLKSIRIALMGLALGISQIALAQYGGTGGTGGSASGSVNLSQTTTTTPGVPSTGLSGLALTNLLIIAFALSLIAIGFMVARGLRKTS